MKFTKIIITTTALLLGGQVLAGTVISTPSHGAMMGTSGNDIFELSSDVTAATGNGGRDEFSYYGSISQPVTITDFNVNNDILDVSYLLSGNPTDASKYVSASASSPYDTVISVDVSGSGSNYKPLFVLKGVSMSTYGSPQTALNQGSLILR